MINAQLVDSDNFATVLFLVYMIPAFLSGFVFFAFSRLIFSRLKLVASDVDTKVLIDSKRVRVCSGMSDISYDSEDDNDLDDRIIQSNNVAKT